MDRKVQTCEQFTQPPRIASNLTPRKLPLSSYKDFLYKSRPMTVQSPKLELAQDVPYGPETARAHLQDILKPKNAMHSIPAIVHFHGGCSIPGARSELMVSQFAEKVQR
jgi:hypothetical protein